MFTAMVPSSSSTRLCPAASAMRSGAFFCGQLQRQLSLAAGTLRTGASAEGPAFPAVKAKVATRRENRIARHERIRKKEVARKVGEVIAKSCLEKGITKVAFDRGGFPYHGRIEALAAAARENGLEF